MSIDPKSNRLPLRMHPRVFAALGADLVTSDVVAIIELVKNSYDALASEVRVKFAWSLLTKEVGLEILDDGHGMTFETIRNVWCTVATPFRSQNRIAKNSKFSRRVSGEKGLGRLAVARLGSKLEMYTKTSEGCWKISVDWQNLSTAKELAECEIQCDLIQGKNPLSSLASGTLIRISHLNHDWDGDDFDDLSDNLSRLVSPFVQNKDFNIFLTTTSAVGNGSPESIKSEPFLDKPKYLIKGTASKAGTVTYKYTHKPLDRPEGARRQNGKITWGQILADNGLENTKNPKNDVPTCGPFDFEIRAWDLSSDETALISDRYNIRKTQVRKAIKAYKGISVYRDGILVLPKSESSRDWLGLDLKRVSRVGDRISTTQIVGYVGISADHNPEIQDTSDRERFAINLAYKHFELILNSVVGALQAQRHQDRTPTNPDSTKSLFDDLIFDEAFENEVAEAAEEGDYKKVGRLLKNYRESKKKVVKEIEQRFSYYSHLATIGAMAETIIHEIRARTGIIARFVRYVKDLVTASNDKTIQKTYTGAEESIESLESLADRFSPLANRNFKRGKRNSLVYQRLTGCFEYEKDRLQALQIKTTFPRPGPEIVAVDPAEFDAIVINLLSNALYWIKQSAVREIEVTIKPAKDGNRIEIGIHDSGPGIKEEDEQKIFLPGITRRPNGIGMGLTVAGELVESYGGKLRVQRSGRLGGASFFFDLPLTTA